MGDLLGGSFLEFFAWVYILALFFYIVLSVSSGLGEDFMGGSFGSLASSCDALLIGWGEGWIWSWSFYATEAPQPIREIINLFLGMLHKNFNINLIDWWSNHRKDSKNLQ